MEHTLKRPLQTTVLCFPLFRRRDLVRRLGAQMVARSVGQAEWHLAAQLRRQRAALQRKGIRAEQADKEIRALTAAVRREIWRSVLSYVSPHNDHEEVGR